MDCYSALSNVAQYCSSDPVGEVAPPSEEQLIVERHDGYKYVQVAAKSIAHGSIADGSTEYATTPITFNLAGNYRIHSTADAPNVIFEANENDNEAMLMIGRTSQGFNTIVVLANDKLPKNLPPVAFGETTLSHK